MKSLLVALAFSSAALSATAFAYTPKTEQSAPPPRVVRSSVVNPTGLPRNYEGSVINVEFSLDKAGAPQNIKVLWVDDAVLKRQLVEAFRQWRFEPAAGDTTVTERRFLLPVQLRPEA